MTRSESSRSRLPVAIALLTALSWSCARATDIDLLEITGTGTVVGVAVLDTNGDSLLTGADEPVVDADVVLVNVGTGQVSELTTTDSIGVFTFDEVPVGSYQLTMDSMVLGDSLSVFGVPDPVSIDVGATVQLAVGITFTTLTLDDAVAATAGQRIFTSGIALNTNPNFGDAQIHFQGDSLFLRALNVERGGINIGDSLRLLGHLVSDNGRPALQDVTFSVLVPQAKLVAAQDVSTGEAATADGGMLDAALARIRSAEITDTSTTPDGHFRFWTDDGSGPVEFVIRDFLLPSINTSVFRPDTTVRIQQAAGLISPYDDGGGVRWRFLPRTGGDVVLETKVADIQVVTTSDVPTAVQNDRIQVTVAVANAGPHMATLLQVSDTIPTGASFVSATTTTGSYNSGTGVWDIGTMDAGAADTLRIDLDITVLGPALVTNIAEHLGLVREVDQIAGNNSSAVVVTIN